jgi:hypothetical protein
VRPFGYGPHSSRITFRREYASILTHKIFKSAAYGNYGTHLHDSNMTGLGHSAPRCISCNVKTGKPSSTSPAAQHRTSRLGKLGWASGSAPACRSGCSTPKSGCRWPRCPERPLVRGRSTGRLEAPPEFLSMPSTAGRTFQRSTRHWEHPRPERFCPLRVFQGRHCAVLVRPWIHLHTPTPPNVQIQGP